MTTFTAGDRVRRGNQTGTVTIGSLPCLPPLTTGRRPLLLEYACRVRWDGARFSIIEDKRTLEKAKRRKHGKSGKSGKQEVSSV